MGSVIFMEFDLPKIPHKSSGCTSHSTGTQLVLLAIKLNKICLR